MHQVKEVDVAWLQAQPENRLAVFQVASNQNGLEQISSSSTVDIQRLDNYPSDKTQGPIASISAAPGLVIRWGYAFFDPSKPPQQWRQSNASQVNFLRDLPLPVNEAGYVRWSITPANGPSANDYQKIKIGYHEGIQVSFGPRSPANQYPFFYDPEQLIDQVFCAAVALGAYQPAGVNKADPKVVAWSKEVLRGIYEGTVRYAALKARKKLFLTRVGGGVFGNDASWIDEAIVKMKDFIVKSGMNVILVQYSDAPSADILQLVKDTKGCYQSFDNVGRAIKQSGTCPGS